MDTKPQNNSNNNNNNSNCLPGSPHSSFFPSKDVSLQLNDIAKTLSWGNEQHSLNMGDSVSMQFRVTTLWEGFLDKQNLNVKITRDNQDDSSPLKPYNIIFPDSLSSCESEYEREAVPESSVESFSSSSSEGLKSHVCFNDALCRSHPVYLQNKVRNILDRLLFNDSLPDTATSESKESIDSVPDSQPASKCSCSSNQKEEDLPLAPDTDCLIQKKLSELPCDLLQQCFARVPMKFQPLIRAVCNQWRTLADGHQLYQIRLKERKAEPWVFILENEYDYYRKYLGLRGHAYNIDLEGRELPPQTPYGCIMWDGDRPYVAPYEGGHPIARLPSPLRLEYSAAGVNGLIYVMGGRPALNSWNHSFTKPSAWEIFSRVDVYDPFLNTWSPSFPLSSPRYAFAAAGIVHSATRRPYIIIAGGFGNDESPLSSASLFDPIGQKWITLPSMKRLKGACKGRATGDRFFVKQMDGGDFLECFDLISSRWTFVPDQERCLLSISAMDNFISGVEKGCTISNYPISTSNLLTSPFSIPFSQSKFCKKIVSIENIQSFAPISLKPPVLQRIYSNERKQSSPFKRLVCLSNSRFLLSNRVTYTDECKMDNIVIEDENHISSIRFFENFKCKTRTFVFNIFPSFFKFFSALLIACALALSLRIRSASAITRNEKLSMENTSTAAILTAVETEMETESKAKIIDTVKDESYGQLSSKSSILTAEEDEQLKKDEKDEKEFEDYMSKPLPLTVPFRIVALRASVPPTWCKNFISTQGKHSKMKMESIALQSTIMEEMEKEMKMKKKEKEKVGSNLSMAADLTTVNDSWLPVAIKNGTLSPMNQSRCDTWLSSLSPSWKRVVARDLNGNVDSRGHVYAIPYRWGCTVIAFRKDKFAQRNIPDIQDWSDLWRKELRGKISFVNCPREIVGCVLKSLGHGYNVASFEKEVEGGMEAVEQKLHALQKQIKLVDSKYYLKALENGEAWVAVGWSSDVFPSVSKYSNLKCIVPNAGTSLWADLWALPDAEKVKNEKMGGRFRGPSPLTSQWIDFCLQKSRALDFHPQSFVGYSPFQLPTLQKDKNENNKGKNAAETTNLTESKNQNTAVYKDKNENVNVSDNTMNAYENFAKDGNAEVTLPKKPKSLFSFGAEKLRFDQVTSLDVWERCEFIEPLSQENAEEYRKLFSSLKRKKEETSWFGRVKDMFAFDSVFKLKSRG